MQYVGDMRRQNVVVFQVLAVQRFLSGILIGTSDQKRRERQSGQAADGRHTVDGFRNPVQRPLRSPSSAKKLEPAASKYPTDYIPEQGRRREP